MHGGPVGRRRCTGRGLEGDRYLAPPDGWAPRGTAITLIEAEAIEAVAAEHGIDMRDGRLAAAGDVTRGDPR